MGLPFDRVDEVTLARLLLEGARAGVGGWVVTPNLDILRQFTTDRESRELILGRHSSQLPMACRSSGRRGSPAPPCLRESPAATWS